MNPTLLKILQGLGLALILTVLSYFADSTNLQSLVNAPMAGLISGICILIEGTIKKKYGRALFGVVRA